MSTEIAHKVFDAVEAVDMKKFRSFFTDDFKLWHNFDLVERDLDRMVADMTMMTSVIKNVRYEERDFIPIPGGILAQFVHRGTAITGKPLALHVLMRIYLAADGRIKRIEEYMESAEAAVIIEAAGLDVSKKHLEMVNKMFDAVEARDLKAWRSVFSEDFSIWHNFDLVERKLDQVASDMAMMLSVIKDVRYAERDFVAVPDGVVGQYVHRGTAITGKPLAMHVMLRFWFAPDGRVRRIEEYLESTEAAVILEAATKAA